MSMMEAVRRLPSLFRSEEEQAAAAKKVDVVEEYEQLLIMARGQGKLERQSATWSYVAAWASRELLKVRARDATSAEQAVAARERSRVLKELLSLHMLDEKKQIELKGHAPEIP